jgi:O-Antigen ligase
VSPSTTLDRPRTPIEGAARLRATALPSQADAPPAPPHRRSDDWPHTSRILPWMIAGFIAMLWLVPFDSISLTVHLPFDLHFDRIVLPFVILAWGLTFVAGRAAAPNLRPTWIHVAVGAYVLVSFVSVLVNDRSLNESLELQDTVKSLLLLSSYVAFFLVIASSVRRTEVRAFFKYTVCLAVLCGLGTLIEYRFHFNAFYSLSATLLPHVFHVAPLQDGGYDELGRPVVLGPGEVGLEVASMLAMAIPLALVGVMTARRRKAQLGYTLAACVILAAGVATYKKTSFVAPAVVLVCLLYVRPGRFRRLLPLAVVMLLGAHVLAPGALGSVYAQFTGGRFAAVGTTQHREDGYDAIRPLVWAHPLFGMGYGSYNGELNRILDNQMLDNLINTGALGEIAYIVMALSVAVVAWPMVRARAPGRDPQFEERAPLALAGAISGIVFLTVSFLFDAMEFPHVPYIFLTTAGLVAVLVRRDEHAPIPDVEPGAARARPQVAPRRAPGPRSGRVVRQPLRPAQRRLRAPGAPMR